MKAKNAKKRLKKAGKKEAKDKKKEVKKMSAITRETGNLVEVYRKVNKAKAASKSIKNPKANTSVLALLAKTIKDGQAEEARIVARIKKNVKKEAKDQVKKNAE